MYGILGKIVAKPNEREKLINILLEGANEMPGCLQYIISKDTEDPNVIWVSEIWENEESHRASLSLPSVQAAIGQGRPLIEGFGERFVTEPVGGKGL